jgi:hypothetical protein
VRSLKVILLLLGALSVLMMGAVPASAMTGDTAPPCHEATTTISTHHEAPAAPAEPDRPMPMAMACCVSCVVMPAPQPPARELTAHPEAPAAPAPARLPVGLSPAPEPGPPKA